MDWPLGNSIHTSETSGEVTVTKNTTANTKGSFIQMIASTLHEAVGFYVTSWGGNPATSYLVDVAIGAAASEHVIVENLAIYAMGYEANHPYFVPLRVPAGSRVSMRSQGNSGSAGGAGVSITMMYGSDLRKTFSRCVTYGANTADSGGTPLVTDNVWAEIAASVTHDIKYLIMAITGRGVGLAGDENVIYKIGIGAAASEQDLIGGLVSRTDTTGDTFMSPVFAFPVSIAAATRIAVQANDNQADIILYGFS